MTIKTKDIIARWREEDAIFWLDDPDGPDVDELAAEHADHDRRFARGAYDTHDDLYQDEVYPR